ncbi:MAG: putative lipid II flippase FtsW [Rhodospirillaceae bacterium]|nr:putative lipid II flippase FtsW [Rhodospirillaceae bacterium]
MSTLARTDTSVIGRWWWTVDRWTLGAVALLGGIGALMILAASPAVADRLNLDSFYFVRRQFTLLPLAAFLLVGVSLLSPRAIRVLATAVFVAALIRVVLTLVSGIEIKGAKRWISLGWFSLQPSEFIKPSFAVVAAWMFAQTRLKKGSPGNMLVGGLFALIIVLLMMQPDFGMTVMVSVVWFSQFFLAGLPMGWVIIIAALGVAGIFTAYTTLPHVASRIDRFLDPSTGDSYQVNTSIEAFMHGGLTGRGPGEGTVKEILPDAHADFIFAVAGEEFGLIACLIILGLFTFIIMRGFSRALEQNSLFILLAASGLLLQFGFQAIINMGSSLHLLPAKGMTLPFISYGGSSLLALSLSIGMVLALTRHRAEAGEQ